MTTSRSPLRIYGRSAELHAVDSLLERLRSGRGGSLLLTARPGLGRSALLEHAAGALTGGCVLHTRATVAERLLAFGGVHALLSAAAGRLAAPPDEVLRTGIRPAGLLGALHGMAARGPLLVCVDDAQLWDDASLDALGFAARRLDDSRPVGILLTVTARHAGLPALAGIPARTLGPLSRPAASALLEEHTGGGTAPDVREELLRECDGNPRLLVELAGRLTPAQLTGRTSLPHPLPAAEALLGSYAAQVRELPPDTRLLLLLAAAAEEHHGDDSGTADDLVLRAAETAGLDPACLGPAEAAGAVRTAGGRVRFDSRLLRRAVYAGEPLARRRAAHSLLSSVLDDGRHPLLRLRHRASATAAGRDPELADALARAATAPAAEPEQGTLDRSAALARAAGLTVHHGTRIARFAAAADLARLAGRPQAARSLLARVREMPASVTDSARGGFARVEGLLALRDGPVAAARETLVHAAALLARDEPDLALDALLGATDAAWAMGDPAAFVDALRRVPPSVGHSPGTGADSAEGAGHAAGAGSAAGAAALLDDYRTGMYSLLSGRFAASRLLLRRAVTRSAAETDPERLLRIGVAALVLGDIESARRADTRALATARSGGPGLLVSQVLEHLAYCELRAGRHARARAHARDGLFEAQRTGQRNGAAHLHAILALVASVEGDAAGCREHAALAEADAAAHGLSMVTSLAAWAVARADLGLGRAAEAAARLGPLVRPGPRHGHFAVRMLAVPCFVEAALLAGVPQSAGPSVSVEEFAQWTARSGDPQAPAQLARCRALLCPPEEADARFAHALALHDRVAGDFERARTQLLYGKWLRRRRRPLNARDHLRDALIAFERCGARTWADQAGEELRATGEAASAERTGSAGRTGRLDGLTPQQSRIARCVAEGATNREVALRLSVSPRTVDHHLRNVFASLGVRSRVELTRLLNQADRNAEKNAAQP